MFANSAERIPAVFIDVDDSVSGGIRQAGFISEWVRLSVVWCVSSGIISDEIVAMCPTRTLSVGYGAVRPPAWWRHCIAMFLSSSNIRS